MKSRTNDRGETLLEIVIALVVIGLVFSGFFAAFSTAASTSSTHRTAAEADAILRNAAEATKGAVRDLCWQYTSANKTASVSTPGATYVTTTTVLPAGFSLSASSSPAGQNCPAVPTSSSCPPTTSANAASAIPCVQQVTFSLTTPNGAVKTLRIELRTP